MATPVYEFADKMWVVQIAVSVVVAAEDKESANALALRRAADGFAISGKEVCDTYRLDSTDRIPDGWTQKSFVFADDHNTCEYRQPETIGEYLKLASDASCHGEP